MYTIDQINNPVTILTLILGGLVLVAIFYFLQRYETTNLVSVSEMAETTGSLFNEEFEKNALLPENDISREINKDSLSASDLEEKIKSEEDSLKLLFFELFDDQVESQTENTEADTTLLQNLFMAPQSDKLFAFTEDLSEYSSIIAFLDAEIKKHSLISFKDHKNFFILAVDHYRSKKELPKCAFPQQLTVNDKCILDSHLDVEQNDKGLENTSEVSISAVDGYNEENPKYLFLGNFYIRFDEKGVEQSFKKVDIPNKSISFLKPIDNGCDRKLTFEVILSENIKEKVKLQNLLWGIPRKGEDGEVKFMLPVFLNGPSTLSFALNLLCNVRPSLTFQQKISIFSLEDSKLVSYSISGFSYYTTTEDEQKEISHVKHVVSLSREFTVKNFIEIKNDPTFNTEVFCISDIYYLRDW
ncbi:hypothetical protein CDIK_0769 [Cucumispora dikerogammari]|nr:hypothetical protein CDIK_0769 [Cucumispora dikerogammari]